MANREILVLGHRGMLGQMVQYYFQKIGYQVNKVEQRYTKENHKAFIGEIKACQSPFIINCIGSIKQKTTDVGDLVWTNAILPLDLINEIGDNQILVQPTTDCVFSGVKGDFYSAEDYPDAADDYGWSKRLGEAALLNKKNALIIRVSIIGLDNSAEPKGLLGWFLNNEKGANLKGYKNHLWNGITTLEWCKQAEKLMTQLEGNTGRIIQLGTSEFYSKFKMLQLFQEYFKTDFLIGGVELPDAVDRRLRPEILSISIQSQLRELLSVQSEWRKKL